MTPPPQPEPWDFWQDASRSPAANMAIDEALLLTSAERGRPMLRFYRWDRLAVSIGYVQKAAAAPEGYAVVRRPTGGGIVYHDHDFTYTVILPAGHWLTQVDRVASYGAINHAVKCGLEHLRLTASLSDLEISTTVDRGSMVCFQHPTKYDILANGEKISGSAQRRTRDGILHQGSIHFGGPLPCDWTAMAASLKAAFIENLKAQFSDFTPPPSLLDTAVQLEKERYACDEWNQRR